MREHNGNLDPAAGAQHLERHIVAVSDENAKIDTCGTKLHSSRRITSLRNAGRRGLRSANFAASRVEFEPERRLQQGERRRRSPRLAAHRPPGTASVRVPSRAESHRTTPEGGANPCKSRRRTELEHMFDRMFEPIARKPERDQRIVVRPDRTIVIGHIDYSALRHVPRCEYPSP